MLKKESTLGIKCKGTEIRHTDSVKYLSATLEFMVTSVIR